MPPTKQSLRSRTPLLGLMTAADLLCFLFLVAAAAASPIKQNRLAHAVHEKHFHINRGAAAAGRAPVRAGGAASAARAPRIVPVRAISTGKARYTSPPISRSGNFVPQPPRYSQTPSPGLVLFYSVGLSGHNDASTAICPESTFRFGSTCRQCSETACPIGQYRIECSPYNDAYCTTCTNKPAELNNTRYTEAGNNNDCEWETCEGAACPVPDSTADAQVVVKVIVPATGTEFETLQLQYQSVFAATAGVAEDKVAIEEVSEGEWTTAESEASPASADSQSAATNRSSELFPTPPPSCSGEIPSHANFVEFEVSVATQDKEVDKVWERMTELAIAQALGQRCLPPVALLYRQPQDTPFVNALSKVLGNKRFARWLSTPAYFPVDLPFFKSWLAEFKYPWVWIGRKLPSDGGKAFGDVLLRIILCPCILLLEIVVFLVLVLAFLICVGFMVVYFLIWLLMWAILIGIALFPPVLVLYCLARACVRCRRDMKARREAARQPEETAWKQDLETQMQDLRTQLGRGQRQEQEVALGMLELEHKALPLPTQPPLKPPGSDFHSPHSPLCVASPPYPVQVQ